MPAPRPSPERPVIVIGAGLAGLAAAVALTEAGRVVTVYEAGPAAGGRCRSFLDSTLGLRIDNGNHLLLSGNRAAFRYLDTIGAKGTVTGPAKPLFPFIDVNTGQRWTLRPNGGRLPWWLLCRGRRVPGTKAADYLALRRVTRLRGDTTVADGLRHDTLYSHLIAPLAIAALNTQPEQGLARLLGGVLRETMLAGGAACRPVFPREGLSETLIDPALAWLRRRGATVHFSRRVTALDVADERVIALRTAEVTIPVPAGTAVVLAVPPWVAGALLPGLAAPDEFQAIVNVHFRLDATPGEAAFIGLIGGTAEWVFVKPGHVSVTISAANRLVDQPAEQIAALVWPEVRLALGLPESRTEAMPPGSTPLRSPPFGSIPPWRVVKEKRATFAATAAQEKLRPGPRIGLTNLALAGDWTDTGLPATIEGAIRSGCCAAQAIRAT